MVKVGRDTERCMGRDETGSACVARPELKLTRNVTADRGRRRTSIAKNCGGKNSGG